MIFTRYIKTIFVNERSLNEYDISLRDSTLAVDIS